MDWNCPNGHQRLVAIPEALECPKCAARFRVDGGVAVFDEPPSASGDPLARLWEAMRRGTTDEALAALGCEAHCVARDGGAGWRYLLAAPAGTCVVEVGSGVADDTASLASEHTTLALVPTLTNGKIVQQRMRESASGTWSVGVLRRLDRLPLADRAVGAIVMDGVDDSGFDLSSSNIGQVAHEWKRVLRPDGVVLIGVSNPLHRRSWVRWLRRQVTSGKGGESVNRYVRRVARADAKGTVGPSSIRRAMADAGFAETVAYAPLPGPNRVQIVLPLDDSGVARYFLSNLVRSESRSVRLALTVGKVFARLGLFRSLIGGYYYLLFRNPRG